MSPAESGLLSYDPNFGGEDCTIKWNDGTVWNDVPCDFTYPCYCQDVKGGGY